MVVEMNRFFNTLVSDKTDEEYVKFISDVLNSVSGFYGRYRSVVVSDNPFNIACGLTVKDDAEKYNNFICDIYFDNKDHDICVNLCYIYRTGKDKTLYFDDVEHKTFADFSDWLVANMNDYLGFKKELAF